MMRLPGLVALAALTAGFAPQTAFADGRPFQGSFAVTFSTLPNTGAVSYCGGPAGARDLEAHGNGATSLGTFAFALFKTGGGGAFHGCLTLTAPNGDILEATYDVGGGALNSHLWAPSTGALTFTGGTGRFKNASGSATFTAMNIVFYGASSWAGGGPATAPIQGMAYYEIEGTIRRDKQH
jgi:hypothetical protein